MGHLGPAKWYPPQGVFIHNPGSWLKQSLRCPEGFSEFLGQLKALEWVVLGSQALGCPELLEGMLT